MVRRKCENGFCLTQAHRLISFAMTVCFLVCRATQPTWLCIQMEVFCRVTRKESYLSTARYGMTKELSPIFWVSSICRRNSMWHSTIEKTIPFMSTPRMARKFVFLPAPTESIDTTTQTRIFVSQKPSHQIPVTSRNDRSKMQKRRASYIMQLAHRRRRISDSYYVRIWFETVQWRRKMSVLPKKCLARTSQRWKGNQSGQNRFQECRMWSRFPKLWSGNTEILSCVWILCIFKDWRF